MAMSEERTVLCGANAYDKKYYYNEAFAQIPKSIQDELHIICVLFTEEIGGIFTIVVVSYHLVIVFCALEVKMLCRPATSTRKFHT